MSAGPRPETRETILAAAYECIARFTPQRTSVDDVAQLAGVSRATMYRYFPGGRDELISAVVAWEYQRFFLRLYESIADAERLEDVMERGLMFAHKSIEDHEVLEMVLRTEPGVIESALQAELAPTRTLVADFLVPYLERHDLISGIDPAEAADFLARMVLSYMSSPGRWDLTDPSEVARLVRAELLAGIAPPSTEGS